MADLDLDAIEARAHHGDGEDDGQMYRDLKAVVAELRELRRREAQWRESFEYWTKKHDHVQRRLSALRADLKPITAFNNLVASHVEEALEADDARALRWRRKQRKAVRRG
jgi:hypothetical protein